MTRCTVPHQHDARWPSARRACLFASSSAIRWIIFTPAKEVVRSVVFVCSFVCNHRPFDFELPSDFDTITHHDEEISIDRTDPCFALSFVIMYKHNYNTVITSGPYLPRRLQCTATLTDEDKAACTLRWSSLLLSEVCCKLIDNWLHGAAWNFASDRRKSWALLWISFCTPSVISPHYLLSTPLKSSLLSPYLAILLPATIKSLCFWIKPE